MAGAFLLATLMMVGRSSFGTAPDGTAVDLFTLTNANGVEVRIMTYGAVIVSIRTPDRQQHLDDIVTGFDKFEDYVSRPRFFGAVAGRYANRIGNARFTLDGTTYELAANNGKNHLHGGRRGFDKVVWRAEPFERDGSSGVVLTHVSPDGDEGYPGRLSVSVTYTLTPRNELVVDYAATADKATPLNLTNHSYFNLSGFAHDVLQHELTIDADRFTPTDEGQIPTGELRRVDGTPFDFRKPTTIGARIDADDTQLRLAGGYDHNFVLNGSGLRHAARVLDPSTGRTMDVSTDQPGVQLYTGNKLDGSAADRHGHAYGRRSALCLETQHFPDSPNHPEFPSTILRPGQEFRSRTIFTFGVAR